MQELQEKHVHDLYNTIAAMTCYAQFLMEDISQDSEMHKFAKSIFTSSKRAKLLLDELSKSTPSVRKKLAR